MNLSEVREEGYARDAVGAMPSAFEAGSGYCVAREGRERLRMCQKMRYYEGVVVVP